MMRYGTPLYYSKTGINSQIPIYIFKIGFLSVILSAGDYINFGI